MAYVAVPNTSLEVGDPIRSSDITQMNDNITNHESRLVAVEDASIREFSHFTQREVQASGGAAFSDQILGAAGGSLTYGAFTIVSSGAIVYQRVATTITNDYHYIQWTGGAVAQLMGKLSFNFASRTKPITYTWRFRSSDVTNAFFMGLTNYPVYGANTTPTDGIYLLLGGAANTFRFQSISTVSAGTTTGGDIAYLANTWYEVKIVFTDDPGNRALCYTDGVLRETITTDLATTYNLSGRFTMSLGAGDTCDIDRALTSAAGTLSDVP